MSIGLLEYVGVSREIGAGLGGTSEAGAVVVEVEVEEAVALSIAFVLEVVETAVDEEQANAEHNEICNAVERQIQLGKTFVGVASYQILPPYP